MENLPHLLCSPPGQPETATTILSVGGTPSFFLSCVRTLKMFASLPLLSLPKPEAAPPSSRQIWCPGMFYSISGITSHMCGYTGKCTHTHTQLRTHTYATNTCANE